ncbi:MAG: spore germination protein [Peptococcaceae bacterium]|nr:spore germination protein [Peptococcaceae bacterium]
MSNTAPTIKIQEKEAWTLGTLVISTKLFLGYPRIMVEEGLTAGWMIVLIGTVLSLFAWNGVMALMRKYPGQSLGQIYKITLGKIFGGLVNGLHLTIAFATCLIYMVQFYETICLYVLEGTPKWALVLLFTGLMILGAWFGVIPIARVSVLSFYPVLAAVSTVLILTLGEMNPYYLLPIGGSGAGNILRHGVINLSASIEVIFLPFLTPYLDFDLIALKRAGRSAILCSGVYFALVTLGYTMLFSLPAGLEYLTPFFQISRMAQISLDFQRLEMIFVLAWTFCVFARLAASLSFMSILAKSFTAKIPYRRLAVIFGLTVGLLAYFSEEGSHWAPIVVMWLHSYSFLIVFGLPLLAFGVHVLKNAGKKKVDPVENQI